MIPLALLTEAGVGLTMTLAVSAIMMGMLVVGPFFLTSGLGLSPAKMGLAMSAGPIMAALSGWPAGRVTERLDADRALSLGLVVMIAGTAGLAGLPLALGTAGFLLGFVTLTPGYQLFLAALNTSLLTRAPKAERGRISGLLTLSRNLGFVLGAGAMAALFQTFPDPRAGMTGTFLVAALLATLALALHRLATPRALTAAQGPPRA
ncbi:MAG: MFS transporter [Pseudomonadota bacterium]